MRLHHNTCNTAPFSFCVPVGDYCPRCDNPIIAPDSSLYAQGYGICHTWTCDDCGHSYRTFVATSDD